MLACGSMFCSLPYLLHDTCQHVVAHCAPCLASSLNAVIPNLLGIVTSLYAVIPDLLGTVTSLSHVSKKFAIVYKV
jgi:hypothetical protein